MNLMPGWIRTRLKDGPAGRVWNACQDLRGVGMEAYRSRLIPATEARGLSATWLGTAGVLLSDGETRLLLDPFVNRPSFVDVALARPLGADRQRVARWVDRVGARPCAAVVVTHSHYDHALDAPLFAEETGARLLGSGSTANIGRGAGLTEDRIQEIEPRTPLRFGAFEVTFLPSEHGKSLIGWVPYPGKILTPLRTPAPARSYRLGGIHAILVRHPAGTLVHHASAATREDTFEGVRADLVFLGLAGRAATAPYLEEVVEAVGARRIIPFHFDNFFEPLSAPLRPLINVGLDEFFRTAARRFPHLAVETLPVGESRIIFPRARAPRKGQGS